MSSSPDSPLCRFGKNDNFSTSSPFELKYDESDDTFTAVINNNESRLESLSDGHNAAEVNYDSRDASLSDIVSSFVAIHNSEDPFYIVNLDQVVQQFRLFQRELPRVTPFYAVKCNPNPKMIQLLWELGAKFDVASRQEMMHVRQVLSDHIGSDALQQRLFHENSMIFANPCKQCSHIKYAKEMGVKRIVVDSETEIYKMHRIYPQAELVVRIKVDDSHSVCQFSSKFGADLELCPKLLKLCSDLSLNVVGISFHCGSGCQEASSFYEALIRAKTAFDMGEKYGFNFTLLDIGGGFHGDTYSKPTFSEVANVIRNPIDELFGSHVEVIAEPGRFFAKRCHTLVCSVIAKKQHQGEISENISEEDASEDIMKTPPAQRTSYSLYINDGLYGSFGCTIFDHVKLSYEHDVGRIPGSRFDAEYTHFERADALSPVESEIEISSQESKEHGESKLYPTTVFGPTCDGIDKILSNEPMPKFQVGDAMFFKEFGAYTVSASTQFNGFSTQKFYYLRGLKGNDV